MPALIDGLVAVAVLLLLARAYSLASSRGIAKGKRFTAGVMVALLAIALFMMREIGLAVLAASGAGMLLFGSGSGRQTGYGPRNAQGRADRGRRTAPIPSTRMSRAEAFSVLGLEDGAAQASIIAAHRRLMLQIHPDKGGSNYLAAKINEAKDVLLGR